jgi:hypothetical protein
LLLRQGRASESTVNVQLLNGARASNIYWVAEALYTYINVQIQVLFFLKMNIVSTADKGNGSCSGRKNYFWPGTIEAPADSPSLLTSEQQTLVLLTEAGDLHNQDYSTYKGV